MNCKEESFIPQPALREDQDYRMYEFYAPSSKKVYNIKDITIRLLEEAWTEYDYMDDWAKGIATTCELSYTYLDDWGLRYAV
jgi:hypothetical protein